MNDAVPPQRPLGPATAAGETGTGIADPPLPFARWRARDELVEVRAKLAQQEQAAGERVRAVEADTRRKAFDEFLADVRIEERHYLREIEHFFQVYKDLEGTRIESHGFQDAAAAKRFITQAIELYNDRFPSA